MTSTFRYDLTPKTDFKVNKSTLMRQAFSIDEDEARTGVIDLSEDHAKLDEVLINYFDTHKLIPDKIREPTDPAKLAKFLVRDYAIATKYRVEGLKMQAGAGFIDLLNGESLEERVVRRASIYLGMPPGE
ncbi:hypothetical protein MPH_07608 [Macrophomina phaseolina MS6]|uniref:Uncharacterized protein n=1 Tax=Macrophomina phaseolina (strain MS6) TaxID=1126212 RepID=K2RQW9_MACPH|nr:hypothetical protein MPH_07608 [Macrophomina phaseolina MS6]